MRVLHGIWLRPQIEILLVECKGILSVTEDWVLGLLVFEVESVIFLACVDGLLLTHIFNTLFGDETTCLPNLGHWAHGALSESHSACELKSAITSTHVTEFKLFIRAAHVFCLSLFSFWVREWSFIHRHEMVDRVLVLTFPMRNLLAKFVCLLKHLFAGKGNLGQWFRICDIGSFLVKTIEAGLVSKESRVDLLLICLIVLEFTLLRGNLNHTTNLWLNVGLSLELVPLIRRDMSGSLRQVLF